MERVTVYITTTKSAEIDIDDNLLRLDIDQQATKEKNDTVYTISFTDENALNKTLDDLDQTFCSGNRLQGYDSKISMIAHPLGILYDN